MSQSHRTERPAVTVTERAAKRIAEIVAGEPATPAAARQRRGRRLLGLLLQVRPRAAPPSRRRSRDRARQRARADRPGLARVSLRLRDRLRRRPDRLLLQGPQPQRHRLVRLRHQLLDLTPVPSAPQNAQSRSAKTARCRHFLPHLQDLCSWRRRTPAGGSSDQFEQMGDLPCARGDWACGSSGPALC